VVGDVCFEVISIRFPLPDYRRVPTRAPPRSSFIDSSPLWLLLDVFFFFIVGVAFPSSTVFSLLWTILSPFPKLAAHRCCWFCPPPLLASLPFRFLDKNFLLFQNSHRLRPSASLDCFCPNPTFAALHRFFLLPGPIPCVFPPVFSVFFRQTSCFFYLFHIGCPPPEFTLQTRGRCLLNFVLP